MTKQPNADLGIGGPGLGPLNFRLIASNGFGDPFNAYPHAMGWFNDHLFVGTTRANLANRAKQILTLTPHRIGKVWPVRIPDRPFDNPLSAEIWRYHPRTDRWKRVYKAPSVRGVDGFEVPISIGFRSMTVFQAPGDSAPALYCPTWASHQTPATVMLKSSDGETFQQVSEPGLGIKENTPRCLRGILGFRGRLFTSPAVGQKRLEPNIAGMAIVYTSADPDHGGWELACDPGFGDPNNLSVFDMTASEDFFYAGTLNVNDGFQVWKTDAEGRPPFKWKKVLTNGAYRGKLNQIAMTLNPFRDHVYIGSAIQNCSWDFDYNVGPAAPEVLRIAKNDSWDLVMGEPRLTPEGLKLPLSGLSPGFRDPFAGYIWAMAVYDGWLYISNAVWALFLRYNGRVNQLPKVLRRMFSPEQMENLLEKFGGCDLWRTRDGIRWLPVTVNGFGNYFNIGFRNMVSSPYGLFVGAANPFAPEVAIQRVAGWEYEHNPRGGVEIWFGTHSPQLPAGETPQSPDATKYLNRLGTYRRREEEGEWDYVERLIDAFYAESGFRHFGFWKVGIQDSRRACENLMDELMAFIPEKKGTIVDIGCGAGATTRCLLKCFPPKAVTGVTGDRLNLKACRRAVPEVRFLLRRLPKLKLPAASLDVVIWAKGLQRLGSRKKLLAECFTALKPGGRLVCFDLLTAAVGKKRLRSIVRVSGGAVGSAEEYDWLLTATGYRDVQITDVTAATIKGFIRYMDKYFGFKILSGEIDDRIFQMVRHRLVVDRQQGAGCLLISCRKPDHF